MSLRIVKELFELEVVTDNPLFEGFGLEDGPSVLGREDSSEDMVPDYDSSETDRLWHPSRLANVWRPPTVSGRVQPYQDFPGISMIFPAFSKRACDVLRDFLEPNGELLPLNSDRGEYFFYNITTVIDALDISKSKCRFWCDPPTTATAVYHFAFHTEKLVGASIFRIIELPMATIVTSEFVERVHENGLNGFHFIKIWPYPEGVDWRKEEQRKEQRSDTRKLKQNTLVVRLALAGKKPSPIERKTIKRLEDDLDAQLAIPSLSAPFFGLYEGSDTVDHEFRIFITCPDADALALKLLPWLKALNWSGDVRVMKRYGEMRNVDAKEAMVDL